MVVQVQGRILREASHEHWIPSKVFYKANISLPSHPSLNEDGIINVYEGLTPWCATSPDIVLSCFFKLAGGLKLAPDDATTNSLGTVTCNGMRQK